MIEVERSVIGCMLLDYQQCGDCVGDVQPEWFEDSDCREIMQRIRELQKRGVTPDSVTILGGLSDSAKSVVIDCVNTVPAISNFDRYVLQLHEEWRKRTVETKLNSLVFGGVDDVGETVEALRTLIAEQDEASATISGEVGSLFTDVAADFITDLPTSSVRHLSGYPQFDKTVGGLLPGSILTLAARPGQGKTDFALSLLMRYAAKGLRVMFCSMEMSYSQLMTRITAQMTGINNTRIRDKTLTKQEYTDICKAFSSVKGSDNIRLTDGRVGLSEIRQIVRSYKPDIVIIDHLGLMKMPKTKTRLDAVAETTRGMKALALETGIAVIQLVQMNREIEKRSSKKPTLSDLKESGTIEEDSDYVVFLRADKGENANLTGNDYFRSYLYIEKNRHGGTGAVHLSWRPQYSRFYELDGYQEYRGDV